MNRFRFGLLLNNNYHLISTTRSTTTKNKEVEKDSSLINIKRALVGNTIVAGAKFIAFSLSGSPAILSEGIHSLVDTSNQILLLIGLKSSRKPPDSIHQFGYGRAAFYYSLISACSIFFLGSCVTIYHSIDSFLHHSLVPTSYGVLGWSVMGISFTVDSFVLYGVIKDANHDRPKGVSMIQHLKAHNDPFLVTLILEDVAATSGVLIALLGMSLSHYYNNPLYDAIACGSIGLLLGMCSVALMRMNKSFLLGKAVDPKTELDISNLLRNFKSVERLDTIKSCWESPNTFAYQCEIDFDGRIFADAVFPLYKQRIRAIMNNNNKNDIDENNMLLIKELLKSYGEDIIIEMEKEVNNMQEEVRRNYPEAEWIEIQPKSTKKKD